MKKQLQELATCLLLATGLTTNAYAQTWETVGTARFSTGTAGYPSLAFSSTGEPYVAYYDAAYSGRATVKKFNGTSWVNVGQIGFSAGAADYISLAFSSSGEPYVAYGDWGNSRKATVMKFDGTAWVNVGQAGFSAGQAESFSLAFSSSGEPYLTYVDDGNSGKATVMRFDGTAWVNVGQAGFSAGIARGTSLAFSNSGEPYVTYRDVANSSKATVMKFNGTAWVNVGTAGFSAGAAYYTSLVFRGTGEPYVAYMDGSCSSNISKATVMKFDGTSWVNVGSACFSVGRSDEMSLAFSNSGEPYVAYQDGSCGSGIGDSKPTVMKFDGISWVNVGSACFSVGKSSYMSLAFRNSGEPYVAYNSNGATVMKFVETTTGIDEWTIDNGKWIIYPNPSNSTLNIQTKEPIKTISIHNTLGALVQAETCNSFSIEQLPAGVYMLHIKTAKGMRTARLVKE